MIQNKSSGTRYYGFDIIKIFVMYVISVWHFSAVVFDVPNKYMFFSGENWLWHGIEYICRTFANGGQIILAVSSILLGMRGRKITNPIFYILLLSGFFIFPLIETRTPEELVLEWDIYGLLLIGLPSAYFLKKISVRLVPTITIASFLLTMIPFWNVFSFESAPRFLRQMFVGECINASGQWPLLPWLFFIWAFYGMGVLLSQEKNRNWIEVNSIKLSVVLIVIYLLFIKFDTYYYMLPDNEETHCGIQRAPPILFQLHLLPIYALMILSFNRRFNAWLGNQFGFVQRFQVSKNLFLVYFLQYPIINFIEHHFGNVIRADGWLCAFVALSIWPITEIITWGLILIAEKLNLNRRQLLK